MNRLVAVNVEAGEGSLAEIRGGSLVSDESGELGLPVSRMRSVPAGSFARPDRDCTRAPYLAKHGDDDLASAGSLTARDGSMREWIVENYIDRVRLLPLIIHCCEPST